jgi:hypothetical protein
MHSAKVSFVVLAVVSAFCRSAVAQQAMTVDQVVDRIVTQEQAETRSLRQYSPLVEIYIQQLRPDTNLGTVPNGDKYFLGRAALTKGVDVEPLTNGDLQNKSTKSQKGVSSSLPFMPRDFLQMIYIDASDFDRQHYKFDYLGREFLGEVRCLIFDVTPQGKGVKGRFLGRIWVEDQGNHIVRFNGAFTGSSSTNSYFHFDSWRMNAGGNQWLPALIYSEEGDVRSGAPSQLAFKAQTRLWGYNLSRAQQEQDLSKVFVEGPTPVNDLVDTPNDLSPLQEARAYDQQAEDNVIGRMKKLGLLAPRGEVDKILETVVNNIEVTNNLDIRPEIQCRVMMTTTLESFTIGHTIVLSRGLIDVLPDEATLASMLAIQMGHVVLDHRIDPQFAFFDRTLFDDRDTFSHFGFARTAAEEQAANDKAAELLNKSPYRSQLGTSQLFLQALQARAKEIPNLISPRLGDSVPTGWTLASPQSSNNDANANAKGPGNIIVALPIGGRVKLDPWSDQLEMLRSKPAAAPAEREKLPFEITPFMLYLTRGAANAPSPAEVATPAK